MKVVAIKGAKSFAIEEQSTPRAQGKFAVVRVAVAPMCTEFKAYSSGSMGHPFGHEAAGEVVEIAMGRVCEAWDLQLRGDCGKVLLYPWE